MTIRQAMQMAFFLKSIACTFPPLVTLRCKLASVLDLEQYHLSRSGHILQAEHWHTLRSIPYSGDQTILMLISLYDVNFVRS